MKFLNASKPAPFLAGYLSGFLFSVYVLSHLSLISVWMESKMTEKLCPSTGYVFKRKQEPEPEVTEKPETRLETPLQGYVKHLALFNQKVQCRSLFNGSSEETFRVKQYLQSSNFIFPSFSETLFIPTVKDCELFTNTVGYKRSYTKVESEFPVAFTIMTHDNIEQVERLLRMVYSPQNIYCIHVDLKAPQQFLTSVETLSKCFPNVFLASRRVNVVYASFSRLRAELNCIEDLLSKDKTWRYYINLASSEIPLKTNLEIVKILKKMNGSNDIEEIYDARHPERFTYKYEVLKNSIHRTRRIHSPAPHNITVTKGLAYGAFSRKFLEFTMTNKIAREFLNWTKDTYSPDEHYWSTLNNLYHNPFLNSPGGSKGFPNVLGCVDGTQIRIATPKENEVDFVNRKGFHSLNVQMVCDPNFIITNCVANWPGSCHDSRIFRESKLCEKFENGTHDGFLLGDSGYPCKRYLMTPYRLTNDLRHREKFNSALCRTRVLVEQTYGILKRRFPCLSLGLRTKPKRACQYIVACVILHNLGIFEHDIVVSDDAELTLQGPDLQPQVLLHNDGFGMRDLIAQRYFT